MRRSLAGPILPASSSKVSMPSISPEISLLMSGMAAQQPRSYRYADGQRTDRRTRRTPHGQVDGPRDILDVFLQCVYKKQHFVVTCPMGAKISFVSRI